jgi:hypothetical protein
MPHSWISRRSEMDFGHWATWELLQHGSRRLEQGPYPDLEGRFCNYRGNESIYGSCILADYTAILPAKSYLWYDQVKVSICGFRKRRGEGVIADQLPRRFLNPRNSMR